MATVAGRWEPGIGDPTIGGWLTVAAYAVAAWTCWRAGQTQRGRAAPAPARYWLLLAVAMAVLGLNKQLDLQSALTQIGRDMARADGWYEHRHEVQVAFIAVVAVAGIAGAAWLGRLSWPLSRGRALALGGIGFLLVFVVARASSFHHVDIWLRDTAFGLRWNWILELSGIALVAFGALRERRIFGPVRARPYRPTPRPPPPRAARPAPAPDPAPPPAAAAPAPARRRPWRGDDRQVVSPGDPRTDRGA